jgi:hypothetical protein
MSEGDEKVRKLMVLQNEKQADIAHEKSITHAKFYCEWCCKQYRTISEWDVRQHITYSMNIEYAPTHLIIYY